MPKVLVLYYSAYGHIEQMAEAVAEGARETGASVDIKRVPELVPEEVAKKSYFKLDQKAPIARIDDLANYDCILIGTGTRFGRNVPLDETFPDQGRLLSPNPREVSQELMTRHEFQPATILNIRSGNLSTSGTFGGAACEWIGAVLHRHGRRRRLAARLRDPQSADARQHRRLSAEQPNLRGGQRLADRPLA